MSTVVLLTMTGLGLGALYFLIASGLSLIFGLMDVLNFAHGALLSIGAYGTWWAASGNLPGAGPGGAGFVLAVLFGTAVLALSGCTATPPYCWNSASSARSTPGPVSRCWPRSGWGSRCPHCCPASGARTR